MIIRATVRDNDYTQYIERFFKQFWRNCFYILDDNVSIEEIIKHDELRDLLNPNVVEIPNNMQKNIVIKNVKEKLSQYLTKVGVSEIVDDLNVEIVDCYKNIWENGEVVYYFTAGNVMISN